jgi:hypothetical protein
MSKPAMETEVIWLFTLTRGLKCRMSLGGNPELIIVNHAVI